MAANELHSYLGQAQAPMAADYNRIRARSSEDPGTAGDESEENWADLLRQWLPSGYSVVTKGRILGATGEASRQVDVLVLRPAYPRGLIEKNAKLFLADGVAAAFSSLNRRMSTRAMCSRRLWRASQTPVRGTSGGSCSAKRIITPAGGCSRLAGPARTHRYLDFAHLPNRLAF
jgi:hypothetical protein